MHNSSAFISYHHEDRKIGEDIKEQLTSLTASGKGRSYLKPFLDVKDIPPGHP